MHHIGYPREIFAHSGYPQFVVTHWRTQHPLLHTEELPNPQYARYLIVTNDISNSGVKSLEVPSNFA